MSNIKEKIRNSTAYKLYKKNIIELLYYFPISSKKIVFDNFGGRGYGDDPKYIAEELRRRNLGLDLIWVTADMSIELPQGIRKVKYGTIRAAYHWSTAKIWIDNIKSSIKVKKKPEQYYIQTWHSTLGFKKNEEDAKTLTEKYIKQAKEDSARTDLMYSNNDFRMDKYRNRYWYNGEVIKCDVPRLSILFDTSEEIVNRVREQFCLDNKKKIVLYAPTFRKRIDTETYIFDYKACLNNLEKKFGGEFVMLIRLHPNERKYNNEMNIYDEVRIMNASNYPDMQELLAVADVLITDYSGCMFDFGLVKKPVFLLAKDFEWYLTEDRDVYFELEELPFSLAKNDKELENNIYKFSDERYQYECNEFAKKVGFNDSGKGAKVIADMIIKKIDKTVKRRV